MLFKMADDREGENEAYKVFQRLYTLKPEETVYPDINMALLYGQAGKPGNAETMMKRAVEKDGENIRTRLAVAKWALDANKLQLAKENADAAAKLAPTPQDDKWLDAKLYVGLVARYMNDLGTAGAAFPEAHQQSPTTSGR